MSNRFNLKEVILKEHSKKQCDKVVAYVDHNSARFAELVNLFLEGPYRITQRAAWPLSCCVERNPTLIQPHLKKILNYSMKPGAHDAVKRNVVRLLQFIEIPKPLQGLTAEICFQFFNNKKESIAVRVFSMTVLSNLAMKLPELKNELIPLIEDQLPYGSAGFISRGRKVLKELKS
jgi:hypothetical protein